VSDLQHIIDLWGAGQRARALSACRTVLEEQPTRPDAIGMLAEMLFAEGSFTAAAAACRRAIALAPYDATVHRRLANALSALGNDVEAIAVLRQALVLEPDNARTLNNLGQALCRVGRAQEALSCLNSALVREPNYALAFYNLGVAQTQCGLAATAISSYQRAITLQPGLAAAHLNLGSTLLDLRRPAEALDCFEHALAHAPTAVGAIAGRARALLRLNRARDALQALGNESADGRCDPALETVRAAALLQLERGAEAAAVARLVIEADPSNADGLVALGLAQLNLGEPAAALATFDVANAISPSHSGAFDARGRALTALGRIEDAVEAYARAVECDPQHFGAYLRAGALLSRLSRYRDALGAYEHALACEPRELEALKGRARMLLALARIEEAAAAFAQALLVAPDADYLAGEHFHALLQCCEWRDFDQHRARLTERVRRGERADQPFSFLMHSESPADQLQCTRTAVAERFALSAPPLCSRARPRSATIRVAYLSADFHEHSTAHLAVGMLEAHDRTRFETYALSFGCDSPSPMRRRLEHAFDRFIDLRAQSDAQIAQAVDALGVDIAVDVKGYTRGCRPGIFALRPAPIQISFLAYPGTMGAPFIDYIVADRQVIPEHDRRHYTEQVIYLPGTYQVNQASIAPAAKPSRRQAGLPDRGVVFCCLNAHYKITPPVFDAWMRILRAVPASVLWLLEGAAVAKTNLRREAAQRGIDPTRLLFAPWMAIAEHLARVSLADLFLDTSPCNAHTTASDALRAGVPVITVAGSTFAGRVATSLLHALGLSDLSVASLDEYVRLAIGLATAPAELLRIRQSLAAAVGASAVFDPVAYCRALESAYLDVWERCQRGEQPASIGVEPGGRVMSLSRAGGQNSAQR
jgi:predicted O-linked N-acetylglucosamine transferase (SPINDLY family)